MPSIQRRRGRIANMQRHLWWHKNLFDWTSQFQWICIKGLMGEFPRQKKAESDWRRYEGREQIINPSGGEGGREGRKNETLADGLFRPEKVIETIIIIQMSRCKDQRSVNVNSTRNPSILLLRQRLPNDKRINIPPSSPTCECWCFLSTTPL